MTRRATLAVVLLGAVIMLGIGPVAASARARPSASAHVAKKVIVDIIGDSLSTQAANYLAADLNPFGAVLRAFDFGGTALCDWVYPHMTTTSTGVVDNPYPGAIMDLTRADAPNVAILQFLGNRNTSCIATSPFSLTGFLANYRYCLTVAITHLLAIGVQRIIVDSGPPTDTVIVGTSALRTLDKSVVASYHRSTIVYAASADTSVLLRGTFAWNLPCLAVETATGVCTGPVTDNGTVHSDIVRSSDGVHFCPATRGVNGLIPFYCPVYSSGAYRFAHALASLVWSYYPGAKPVDVPVVSAVTPDVGPDTGGTIVTLTGFHLATVHTVQFVELFAPLINGVETLGGSPVTVVVTAGAPTNVTDSSLTVTAPPVTDGTYGDVKNIFIRVISSRAESVIGPTSDAFFLTTTTTGSTRPSSRATEH